MPANPELLVLLKKELEFLQSGGYRDASLWRWRVPLVFEDSPTCLTASPERSCTECPLLELVPKGQRDQSTPCRHIPLNESGLTIHDLYRWGTREELEEALSKWLIAQITRLEQGE